ncbi:hypothetical protein TTHERM_00895910 (macronuclear) [Tetrahymena thermophila SB210]|uniref:Uncharacterized protein n=1 Tax=Tetrahymena thermophila (strain SB210) TaxID=312017 RepID=Q22E39_TETTS|nr:hypothetical protein TTHERM_00895910 [Tetrahymena thermophila SB210]EAR83575.2 hypothetical protein TTHERM_00895910 [Tetrahymena thermophila SB210]|eukprot:XP_001031238.2 hypothetical protein TTHERM_00895910 [Tetrahymena thermophila SB210]
MIEQKSKKFQYYANQLTGTLFVAQELILMNQQGVVNNVFKDVVLVMDTNKKIVQIACQIIIKYNSRINSCAQLVQLDNTFIRILVKVANMIVVFVYRQQNASFVRLDMLWITLMKFVVLLIVLMQISNGVVTGFTIYPIKCLDTFQINTAQNSCGCFNGVYLNNGVCVPCQDPNCQVCSQFGCTYCKIGYFNQQGSCVTNCKPQFYYQQTSNNYHFSCFPFTFHKIIQINGQNVSNNWKGYDPKFGIFDDICQPFLFKLFNYASNSYQCVSACPIGYTLNLLRLACVENNCQNDITLQINGNCFFRTCPSQYFFQPFQSFTQYSTCIPISMNQCLYQLDESMSQCLTCQPSYFTSSCVQNCPSQIYYQNKNSCIKCDMTTPTCSQTYFLYTYNVNGINYNAYTCPTNYYLPNNSSQCTQCSNLAMISCDTKSEYYCDIGQDNSDPSCPIINLQQMVGYSFDKYGNIVSNNNCLKINTTNNLCSVCNLNFNYNFQGVCSQLFMRPTKYYMYYNITESQYRVVGSCTSNQYIQSIQKSSYYIKYCKDFSTCLTTTQATINGQSQQICQKCSTNFFNINGNCIDSCPSYTFQNSSTKNCETPINYCDTYSSNTITPLCTYCQYGYLLLQTSPSSQCIPFNSCNNGFTYIYNLCIACDPNCNQCLSNKKCIQPSTNYYLYNDSPVTSCPPGTYLSGFSCLSCEQYCLSCTDSNNCTQRLPASLLYLINAQVYVYFNPICQLNQYYDTNLQQCVNCDQSCSQCYQASSKCLLCSDITQSLYKYTCVQQCPNGFYTSVLTTTNYTRNVCLQCDQSCLKCNQTTCNQCVQPNMYQNPVKPFICQASSDPCCSQVDITTGLCQQCYSNCLLDNNSKLCYQIIPYCSQYQLTDKTKCSQCQLGYYLTSQYNCCGVQNCKICNDSNLQQSAQSPTVRLASQNKQCVFDCQFQIAKRVQQETKPSAHSAFHNIQQTKHYSASLIVKFQIAKYAQQEIKTNIQVDSASLIVKFKIAKHVQLEIRHNV